MARERDVLRSVRARFGSAPDGVWLGPGDDAALLDDGTVITTDTVVEGVHADRRWSSLADIGWKAVHAAVSDIPAMGAVPTGLVVGAQLPASWSLDDVDTLLDGLAEGAAAVPVPIVGGDVTSSPVLALSVTVTGRLVGGDPCTRAGAGAGDVVCVIGHLGRAAAGLALHVATADGDAEAADLLAAHPELSGAHRRPVALVAAADILADESVTAGIDVSDGLGRDLGHVAESSGVGIELSEVSADAMVTAAAAHLGADATAWVLGGGDDHALAITVTPASVDHVRELAGAAGLPFRVMGTVRAGSGVHVDGTNVSDRGWEHQ